MVRLVASIAFHREKSILKSTSFTFGYIASKTAFIDMFLGSRFRLVMIYVLPLFSYMYTLSVHASLA